MNTRCIHDGRACPFQGCSTTLCARHEFVPVDSEYTRGDVPVQFAGDRVMVAGPCGRDTAFTQARGLGSLRPLSVPVASGAAGKPGVEGCETSPKPNRRRSAVGVR